MTRTTETWAWLSPPRARLCRWWSGQVPWLGRGTVALGKIRATEQAGLLLRGVMASGIAWDGALRGPTWP